jgi:hypothetical protein
MNIQIVQTKKSLVYTDAQMVPVYVNHQFPLQQKKVKNGIRTYRETFARYELKLLDRIPNLEPSRGER